MLPAADHVTLPDEGPVLIAFPADVSAVNSLAPTPDGSPEARKLTFHEPGIHPVTCLACHLATVPSQLVVCSLHNKSSCCSTCKQLHPTKGVEPKSAPPAATTLCLPWFQHLRQSAAKWQVLNAFNLHVLWIRSMFRSLIGQH